MQVKFFRIDNKQPDALQELEQQINDFLSSLTPNKGNAQTTVDIQYLNDHQSNLFAMVYYDGLSAP